MTRLGEFLHFVQPFKPVATMNLPKSTTSLGNFCKGVKIIYFFSEIIFGQLLETFGDFYQATLNAPQLRGYKKTIMLLPSFAAIQVCFLERLLQNSAISKLGNNFSASFDARNQFAHGKLYIGSLNSSKSCKLAPTCLGRCKHIKHFKSYKNIGFFDSALYGTTMELFSRKR